MESVEACCYKWMHILKLPAGRNYIYFNQIEQLMTRTIKINDVTLGTKHSTSDNYFISGNVWTEGRGRIGRIIWRITGTYILVS